MAKKEKVLKLGIKKKNKTHIYFISKGGKVSSYDKLTEKKTVLSNDTVKRAKGYLYFVDGDGDVSRSKMASK